MKPTLNSADVQVIRELMREEGKDIKRELRAEILQSHDTLNQKIDLLDKKIDSTKREIISEIADSIANSVLPVQDEHEKRITRIEKHLSLKVAA